MSRFVALVVVVSAAAFAAPTAISQLVSHTSWPSSSGKKHCLIKGNISWSRGERIYHVPGQKYYRSTNINRLFGERWFCSESEARAAGWRKARR